MQKWLEKGRFAHLKAEVIVVDDRSDHSHTLSCNKTVYFRVFPMLVPSLSW